MDKITDFMTIEAGMTIMHTRGVGRRRRTDTYAGITKTTAFPGQLGINTVGWRVVHYVHNGEDAFATLEPGDDVRLVSRVTTG
jgi:hypothetical protein